MDVVQVDLDCAPWPNWQSNQPRSSSQLRRAYSYLKIMFIGQHFLQEIAAYNLILRNIYYRVGELLLFRISIIAKSQ
jgi:hypothetical protein